MADHKLGSDGNREWSLKIISFIDHSDHMSTTWNNEEGADGRVIFFCGVVFRFFGEQVHGVSKILAQIIEKCGLNFCCFL